MTPILPIDEGLRALSAVRQSFPRAILAGGYLRDCILGVQPKDIDIFVPHPGVFAGERDAGDYAGDNEVASIINWEGFSLPVQVITLTPGLAVVDRVLHHDFGICQVWHDGTELKTSMAFDADVQDRTFTLMHCESPREFKRSMVRFGRLSLKYPGFELVVPDRFATLQAIWKLQAVLEHMGT